MTDPVTRAARRQNLIDRLAEHLTEWGCPADTAPTRAGALLITVEAGGWSLPTIDAPPLSGRGSTDEGRERARLTLAHTRAGCRCPGDRSLPLERHPADCGAIIAAAVSS
jgi:hypothetical protein